MAKSGNAAAERILTADELFRDAKALDSRIGHVFIVKQLTQSADVLKKSVRKEADERVGVYRGVYHKSFRSGKPYVYDGAMAIRVYAKRPAYHANLIEYGHHIGMKGEVPARKVFAGGLSSAKAEILNDIREAYQKELEALIR